jgi:hypothetical protein
MKTAHWLVPFVLLILDSNPRPAPGASPTVTLPIKLRDYPSIVTGISERQARAATQPAVALIGRLIDYPIDLDIEINDAARAGEVSALMEFGRKLDAGEIHLGVMWGIEFGWLQEKYPRLKPLALCVYGSREDDKEGVSSQLMVAHGFDGDRLDDLRGKTLAVYRRVPLMDKLFLNQALADRNHTLRDFFGEIKEFKSARDAIVAVNRGAADCVLLNMVTYSRHVANQPKLTLRPLASSGAFAAPVIVGRPNAVDDLRRDLWRQIQEETLRLHQTPEGKQCMQFWRLARFGKPNVAFDALVRRNVADYPINVLLRLRDESNVPK